MNRPLLPIDIFVSFEDQMLTWQFALATELSEMGKKNAYRGDHISHLFVRVVNSRFKICSQIWNFVG